MPRTTAIDLYSGVRRAVQRVDQGLVHQAVHLEPDARRLAGPRQLDLVLDQLEHRIARGQRAEAERIHRVGFGIAGHVVEQPRRITGQIRHRS